MEEDHTPSHTQRDAEPAPGTPAATTPPERIGLLRWIAEGLRAACFLKPRTEAAPHPWQLLALVLLAEALSLGLTRLQIDGPARLVLPAALNQCWIWGLTAWIGWWALSGRPGRPTRWMALVNVAGLPASLALGLLALGYSRDWLPAWLEAPTGYWTAFGIGCLWMVFAAGRLALRESAPRWRTGLVAPAIAAVLALSFWQQLTPGDLSWVAEPAQAAEGEAAEPRPRLRLTQEVFEQQQALWERTLAGIAPRSPDRPNVYGLVFAPFAAEDVFLRESTMVAGLLAERFDARGRVLQLLNNPRTTETLPWATPLNLRRGIAALAQRMDRENDLLIVYMTSHGAADHQLAATHGPLSVPWLTPAELRAALDEAGIRHRVLAISACYSGGWIEPLADAHTLVLTAADATHTSYGCGSRSELTFFGRAMFDEELRKTRSFEAAFAAAVPVIRQREIEAGKDDGFSNPQLRMGEKIRPVLDALAQRLDAEGR
ncbi:C13 family peptidase [Variovorax sp.]|jgi:hypothetical protein|uniref:C13 family peptidase n=1 Tax=Variovorax sp. TaxID=1871043 RepID=UPI0037DA661C